LTKAALTLVRRLLESSLGLDPAEAPFAQVLAIASDNAIPAGIAFAACRAAEGGSAQEWGAALAREATWASDHAASRESVATAVGPLMSELADAAPDWRRDKSPVLELAAPEWAADGIVARLVTGGMFLVRRTRSDGEASSDEHNFRLVSIRAGGVDAIRLTALQVGMLGGGADRARMTQKGWQDLVLLRVSSAGRVRLADVVDLAEAGWFDAQGSGRFDSTADLRSTMRGIARAAGARRVRRRSLTRVLNVTGGDPARRAALVRQTASDLERVQLAEEVAVVDAGAPEERPPATTHAYERALLLLRRSIDRVEVRLLQEPGTRSADPVNDAKRTVNVVAVGKVVHDRARLLRAASGNRLSEISAPATTGTGWQLLLPVDPGGPVVAVDVAAPVVEALRLRYPEIVAVSRSIGTLIGQAVEPTARPPSEPGDTGNAAGPGRGLLWDGSSLPLRSVRSGLVIVDDRKRQGTNARERMGPGAAVSSIRSSRRGYDYALYPRPEDLLWVTRRGWPVIGGNTLVSRVRRWRARSLLWSFMDRAGLSVETTGPTGADLILSELADSTGSRYELRGIITRNCDQATLRVEDERSALALRVALTPRGRSRLANLGDAQERVLALPGPLPFAVPRVVAKGESAGIPWLAEEWFAGRPGPGGRRWRTRAGEGWAVGRSVAKVLAEHTTTGTTRPGWASTWGGLAVGQGTAEEELTLALEAVEGAAVSTAWCHGDLWPGNVLFGRRRLPVVVDWDSARSDAPAGIDAIHMEIDRVAWRLRCSVGVAAALLVVTGAPELHGVAVGGRQWAQWDADVRGGLVSAAVALRASRGSQGPGAYNEPWNDEMLPPLAAALRSVR